MTTGMYLTLYMDLSLKDWQCAQRTSKVPLGKKGYIRLFEHPISSSGAKSLMSVKVIFSDEGVLTYSQAGTLKKPVLDDGREWRAWQFKGCLPLKERHGLVSCQRIESGIQQH